MKDKGCGAGRRIRGRKRLLLHVVTVGLRPEEDVEVLDCLAGAHGSQPQAVTFSSEKLGVPCLEFGSEVVKLREEVAALGAAVERFDRVEVRVARDDDAVKQVLGALLSVNRVGR